jgi:tripartite-type tricarboxylate transporter receptor subunit TctC
MNASGIKRRSPLAFGAISPLGSWANADELYPTKPITLLVGFAPGGQSDILARKIGKLLEADLNVPVVIKNLPGAASTMSLRQLASAKPDGYTLAVTGGSGMVMAPLIMKVPYSPTRSFKTVGMVTMAGGAIAVHPSVPARNLTELVQLIKASPDKYSFAHSGTGGIDHLTGELFKKVAGDLKLVDIPYPGSAPAIQAVVAGQVPVLSATFSSTYKFHQAGQLRVLAITSAKRSQLSPEVQTAAEQGLKDLMAETYNFVTAPIDIPEPVLTKFRGSIAKIIGQPAVSADLAASGFEPVTNMSPEAADAFIAAESVKWRKVVESPKITVE